MPTAANKRPGKRRAARISLDDPIGEIVTKTIDGLDPMMMWQYFSLRLMQTNHWTEDDLKAQVDNLWPSIAKVLPATAPKRAGRSKAKKKHGRRG